MVCRTYENRHVPRSPTALPAFDKFFSGQEGFIRPVHTGQMNPVVPSDVTDNCPHYLVQDLDGDWVALLALNSAAVFAEVEQASGVPIWSH